MTLTQSLYARRNGGMVFWRIGCLGGSFYWSRASEETKASAKAARRDRRYQRQWEARQFRRMDRKWWSTLQRTEG